MTQTPVATKPLLCPHGYEVQIGSIHKLIWYAHPDKKGCDLLNRYNVTTEQVLLAIVGDDKNAHSQIVIFTAIASSAQVRVGYYNVLASLDGDKLRDALVVLWHWLPLLPDGAVVSRELEHVFGKVLWENMRFVSKGQNIYPPGFTAAVSEREVGHLRTLPKLEMENLQNGQQTRAFLDIEEATNKTKRYRKRY